MAANDSERPSPLDTTKDKWYKPGSGSSSECPRQGSILLERRRGGGVTIVQTNCNSWRCLGCRDRNSRRFRAIVEVGCSTLKRSCFITTTYRAGSSRLDDAECVGKDWRALWRHLRKSSPWTQKLEWLRVMEVTKRQTPHFHLIAGPIPEGKPINCWGSSLEIRTYRERLESCECVAHTFARSWSRVQRGESYLVHAIAVSSAKGAGKYLAKYMGKAQGGVVNHNTGMKRRWSTSRGWPAEKRVRLVGSIDGDGWTRRSWAAGPVRDWDELQKAVAKNPANRNAGERRMSEKQVAEAKKRAMKAYMRIAKEGSQ